MLRKLLIVLMVVIICGVAFHELGAAITGGTRVATSFTFHFKRGWNLMSVPLSGFNPNPYFSFSTAYDFFYYWDGEQYKIADTNLGGPGLVSGKGYWAKYIPAENYTLTDQGGYILLPLTTITIDVKPGWNLIGTIYNPIKLDDIVVSPAGNVISCFAYEGGYYVVEDTETAPAVLQPGQGYWVNVREAGTLTLSSESAIAGSKPSIINSVSAGTSVLNKLTISDSAEGSMKLYYGIPAQPIDPAKAKMPAATGESFDVRFNTNAYFVTFASATGQTYIIKVSSATYPLTLAWNVKQANLYLTRIYYSGIYKDINVNGTGSITINGPVSNIVLQVSPLPVIKPPSTCFLKGTPILMADGTLEPIEKIRVKDKVMAYDEVSKQLKPDTVKKTFRHKTDQYLIVNGHLKVTPNHPVFSSGKWIEIGKLRVGDTLLNAQGKLEPITSIKLVNQKVRVFHFEVNPYHTFIAGGIVVHNAKAPPSSTVKAVN